MLNNKAMARGPRAMPCLMSNAQSHLSLID